MINSYNSLDQYCEKIVDCPHSTPKWTTTGHLVIRNQNIRNGRLDLSSPSYTDNVHFKERIKRARPAAGDLVFTREAPMGEICKIPENVGCCVGQRQVLLRSKQTNSSEYLLYAFQSPFVKKQISQQNATGSTVSNFCIRDLKNLRIPRLENEEQIAAVLSALDAKIELNNRMNAELEAMAKTLYDYWFVQFDFPFNFDKGVPDPKGKPYKSSGGKMVYNKTLKREIPEGWVAGSLASLIGQSKTGDWGKDFEQGNFTEKVFCIRGADINGLNGTGAFKSPVRFILKNNLEKLVVPNDLIVEISGGSPTQSTGRLAVVTEQTLARFDAPVICSNFCKAISLKQPDYTWFFVYLWNLLYENNILFGWEGKTSGIKNLLFDSFTNNYQVCIAPEILAKSFYDFVEPWQKRKQQNLQENQQLARLRDWLLPMLMNGQVSVG